MARMLVQNKLEEEKKKTCREKLRYSVLQRSLPPARSSLLGQILNVALAVSNGRL